MSLSKQAIVVDNVTRWREVYSAVLQQEGYEVKEFSSVREATSYLHNHRPNVAVIHLHRDVQRSLAFIKKCAKFDSSISILYPTFHQDPELHQEALKLGAFAVLEKGVFDRAKFGRILERAFNQSVARQQHRRGGPSVFVLMPFAKRFERRYLLGIKEPLESLKIRCERVDKLDFSGDIMARLFQGIRDATIIVADMTAKNPNVFYEVGYAHALEKPVILLTEKADEIPFNLKHQKHIVYGRGVDRLKAELLRTVKAMLKKQKA